jgi:hypothetical protein
LPGGRVLGQEATFAQHVARRSLNARLAHGVVRIAGKHDRDRVAARVVVLDEPRADWLEARRVGDGDGVCRVTRAREDLQGAVGGRREVGGASTRDRAANLSSTSAGVAQKLAVVSWSSCRPVVARSDT